MATPNPRIHHMKRALLTTAAVATLALITTGAMAQTKPSPPPVPGAFGEVRDANPISPQSAPGQLGVTGTCAPVPNASGSQTTNPCTYGNPTEQSGVMAPSATGSVKVPPAPVPNASGSQTTNPATYRNTTPQ